MSRRSSDQGALRTIHDEPSALPWAADAETQAPEQQSIRSHDSTADEQAAARLARAMEQLQAKELQLQALSDSLAAVELSLLEAQRPKQSALESSHQQAGAEVDLLTAVLGSPTTGPASSSGAAAEEVLSARWRCLAAQRAELTVRWQCLLEEKKQLSLLMQAGQGECRCRCTVAGSCCCYCWPALQRLVPSAVCCGCNGPMVSHTQASRPL